MTSFSCSLVIFLVTVTVSLAAKENMRKLSKANNDLAFNIYRQLAWNCPENIFFSPLSLSTAFGMLYYGTKGETAKELRNVLRYEKADLPEELVHRAFQEYLTEVLPSQDASAYVLNSANSVLLNENLDIKPSYKKEVQDLYQASVKIVDFATKSREVVKEVNNWVKEKTNGKISKLLDKLDTDTAVVLLNAVYFKGTWKTQFKPSETKPKVFYDKGLKRKSKEVPMMRMTEKFPYASVSDAQVLEMPYKGENMSMVVLLPKDRDGLKAKEQSLTFEKFSAIRQKLRKTKVHLTLPKFKVEYFRDQLSGEFQSLGAKSIFEPGADFSGMTSNKKLYVSRVLHKAVVEVNEEGSEAAAATGNIVTEKSGHSGTIPDFVADHPFLFAIVDKRNDMILFLGRVTTLQ